MTVTNVEPDATAKNQPVKFKVSIPIVLDICGLKVSKKDLVVDLGDYEFTTETWSVIEQYQQQFQSEGLPVPSHVELAKLCMFWGIDQKELGPRLHTLREQLHALKDELIKPAKVKEHAAQLITPEYRPEGVER